MIFRGKLFKFKSRHQNCRIRQIEPNHPGFNWLLKIAFLRSLSLSKLSLVGCWGQIYQNSLIDGRRCYILFRIGRSLNVGQCWGSDELLLRGEDIEWNCLFMYFREMKSDYPTKSGFFTYGWAVIDLAVKSNRRCGWYDSLQHLWYQNFITMY